MRRQWLIFIPSLAALCLAGIAAAQAPGRPIRMVVSFVVGTPDAIARTLAAQLMNQMGHNVIVDNRAGANGIITELRDLR